MTDRNALIQEAVGLGYKEDEIARTPTYVIQSIVAERKKKKNKPPPSSHKAGAADVHVYAEQITDTVPPATTRVAEEMLKKAEADDDTKTVVNMDFMTKSQNSSDQKYNRFAFLVAAKNDLIKAIKTNSALLESHRTNFDEDDVQVIRREIEHSQYQLGLVNTEMREIQQWFSEVHQEKHVFYQQCLQSSADVSGHLTSHFQRKMENIQKYMRAMHDQAQLTPEDLK